MSDVDDASRLIRSDAVALAGYSELVWVTGPDAVSFLDGLLSQNIADIEVGTSAPSLLLAPNGKLRELKTTEKAWGPHYLRFGLIMETDFEGSGIFNIASSHTMTPIITIARYLTHQLLAG